MEGEREKEEGEREKEEGRKGDMRKSGEGMGV